MFRLIGHLAFAFLSCTAMTCSLASGQEPDNGRTRAPAARSTREFLGLGTPPNPAAAAKGDPLFKQNCAACHGADARGGQGPNLVRSVVVLHDEKENEIKPLVREGRPQAGMPAFRQLSDEDIHDIAEYIKLQIEQAANRGMYNQLFANSKNQIHGNPQKGATFFQQHCVTCHSATGDLAKIGAKYPQASVMQSRFLWPVSREAVDATVIAPAGTSVSGVLVKFDDFDVALRDSNGEYHYWPRSQVQVTVTDKLKGHRSLLPLYSDADVHDVTAYLESLQ